MASSRAEAQKALFGGGSLDSSEGLYRAAQESGFGEQADRAIEPHKGDKGAYLSGGFVSDSLDVLSTLDYGITGVLKGDGFINGVRNKSSFADDDALGRYGVAGKYSGIAADIALGVATSFIPVFGWAKGAARTLGIAKFASTVAKRAVGEMKPIMLSGGEGMIRVGGIDMVVDTFNKFLPHFSFDPGVNKKLLDADAEAVNLAQQAYKNFERFDKYDDGVVNNIFTKDANGRLIRKNGSELMRDFTEGKGLEEAMAVSKNIDDLMLLLIEKGGLSREVAEEQFGKYLTQSYDEVIMARAERPSGSLFGGGLRKGRNYELSEEGMQKLGQVTDMRLVVPNTMNKIIKNIHDAELGNILSKHALTTDDIAKIKAEGGRMTDYVAADSLSMYKSGIGTEVELKRRISEVSKIMKPVLKDLRKALKGDEMAAKEIADLEKRLSNVKAVNLDSYSELMSDVRNVVAVASPDYKLVAKLSEGQQLIHGKIAKFMKSLPEIAEAGAKGVAHASVDTDKAFTAFLRTADGKELKDAFRQKAKMQGFDTPFDFWNRAIKDEGYIRVSDSKLADTADATVDEYKDAHRKLLKETGREYTRVGSNIKLKKSERNQILSKVIDNEQLLSDLAFRRDNLTEQLLSVQSRNLSGKFINRHIQEMVESLTSTQKEVGEMFIQRFKRANVVWNPAAIVRNALSATIQNWWKLGMGPWRVDIYADAVKTLNKGLDDPIFKEMTEQGYHRGMGGLQEVVSQAFSDRAAAQAGSVTGKAGMGVMRKMAHFLEVAYGYPDDVAKIAAYKYARSKGLDKETALRRAYAATFDYSEVTPLVRRMRNAAWGVPFITFAIKSVPLVASTAVHARHRMTVFQKIRDGMYNAAGVEGQEEREVLPEYMKEGVFIKMPFKNEDGSSAYFDMSYIIPFGAMMDGTWLKDPISANIITQFVREMSTNKTFSGHTIFKEGASVEENLMMLSLQVTQRFIPKYIQQEIGVDGYNTDGTLRVNGLGGRAISNLTTDQYQSYEFGNLLAKNLAMKFTKLDQDTATNRQEWAQRQALQKVLVDNGVLKQFTKAYLPKEEDLLEFDYKPEGLEPRPIGR